jgi:predicted nucleic acid-binding protein
MLIDSNILVYALNTDSPKCVVAQEFLLSQKQLVLAQQNISEVVRILTHHKFPHPYSINDCLSALRPILDAAVLVHPLMETTEVWLRLLSKYQMSGVRVLDAYLVATALSNSITTIATDNVKDFKIYQEIEVYNPFDVAKS